MTNSLPNIKGLGIFIRERFTPAVNIPMIGLFVLGHFAFQLAIFDLPVNWKQFFLLFISITCFFLKMRSYDEIKDYQLDCQINPHRPLPRGVIKHKDLIFLILFCVGAEWCLFFMANNWQFNNALAMYSFAIFYSFLMFKEFFIPKIIRPHLTTYAVIHTVVTVWMSLSLSWLILPDGIGTSDLFFCFALAAWSLFNLYEFGRKTFASNEERANIDSYSSVWGKGGAVVLSLSQALLAPILLSWPLIANQSGFKINSFFLGFINLFYLIPLSVLLSGLHYFFFNHKKSAAFFRNVTSVAIALFYLLLNIMIIHNYFYST